MDLNVRTDGLGHAGAAPLCDITNMVPEPREDIAEMSPTDLLNRAKTAIENGENSFRLAAECLAAAERRGVPQRTMAKEVGKSHAWVNGLLKWRANGYRDTPFGPQAKASRQRARGGQTTNQAKHTHAGNSERGDGDAQRARAEAAKAQAEAEKAKADAAKAEAEARAAEARAKVHGGMFRRKPTEKPLPQRSREILVKTLGMLGSDQPGERANAADAVEKQRRDLHMTWDELIISATVFNANAA